jgi:outer membrane protein assembly factor BamA
MIAALLLAIAMQGAGSERPGLQTDRPDASTQTGRPDASTQTGRPDLSGPAPQERIAEIRVHGNATLSDDAVIAFAGVAVGSTLDAGGVDAVAQKLRDSGRFDEVDVRKRYRTLAMDEVALVLLVHEKQGVSPTGEPPSAMKKLRSRLMFFPILDYDDGYGWTYGGRTTIVDILGKGTHVSVPLSWGGTREAAVEADHTFKSGPLTRLSGSFGVAQRENPHYEIDDRRTTLSGRAERRLFDKLTLGAEAGGSRVTFEPSHDRFWSGGADVTLDTRNDPGFPTDAILASAAGAA